MIPVDNLDMLILLREELADLESLLGAILPTTSFHALKEAHFLLTETRQVLEEAVE